MNIEERKKGLPTDRPNEPTFCAYFNKWLKRTRRKKSAYTDGRTDGRTTETIPSHKFLQTSAKNCPPPSSHVIQLTGTISKFHENWAKNVTSTVFTCFHYIHIEKNAPPTGGHVFSLIPTIFKLVRDINKTNVLTNLHDDWAKIVTSRVFTRFLYSQIGKTATIYIYTGGHVFSPISTIFKLVRDIMFTRKTAPPTGDTIKTNILTNFELD
ncbi:hypothetical protein DPMN_144858 [Dreissena polymorpha]|uniref:Uncharacterized protein n=1 Tax=Dreissena polymorpha TaxID=45954 RepID=A0A9D4J0F7_DREPO|nr:hypothetical protein DPMN_144858 [Dreissena polymorpha]